MKKCTPSIALHQPAETLRGAGMVPGNRKFVASSVTSDALRAQVHRLGQDAVDGEVGEGVSATGGRF